MAKGCIKQVRQYRLTEKLALINSWTFLTKETGIPPARQASAARVQAADPDGVGFPARKHYEQAKQLLLAL